MISFDGDYHDIANWLYKVARENNGENLWVKMLGEPVFLIQCLDDADHVLRTNAASYKKNMDWFRHMLGQSRFSEDGKAWEIRRDLTQKYLAKFDREKAFFLAKNKAKETIFELAADSNVGALVIDEFRFRNMAMSVLVENFFDVPLAETGVDLDTLGKVMEFGSEYAFVPPMADLAQHHRLSFLPALRRQLFEDFKKFRAGNLAVSPLLDTLLVADQDPSNDILLEHELLTFFTAGADTTAAAVGWACYVLAKFPDLQIKLRAELSSFWDKGQLTWKELSQVTMLEAFVSEVLRLYPPIPVVTRLACVPDKISEISVAEGDNVSISIVGIQHDARIYTNPWCPDLDSYRNSFGSGANVGFVFGPRICGGKKFALVELATFVAVFLRFAEFSLTNEDEPSFYWKSLMLREGGQPVRVKLLV